MKRNSGKHNPKSDDWLEDEDDGDAESFGAAGKTAEPEKHSVRRKVRADKIKILYHDKDLVVLDKPVSVSLEESFEESHSVQHQLTALGLTAAEHKPLETLYPLDPEASGVLVVARHAVAMERLRRDLAEGRVELCFLAIVRGRSVQEKGRIEGPLARQDSGGGSRKDLHHELPAITEWRVRDGFVGLSLLECRPRTGQMAQIRIHLAQIGLPLAIDPVYGGGQELRLSSFKAGYRPSRKHEERPLISRLTLHAWSADLTAGDNQCLHFEAPMPKDFHAALLQLTKYGRLPL